MKMFLHSAMLAMGLLVLACSSKSQVDVGDRAPAFKLKDQDGRVFDLGDVLGRQPLVVYFYPKDETSVCTKEACSFRDAYEQFKAHGAMVIGISMDGVESHKKFAQHHNLPFTLLADTANMARQLFGVPKTLVLPGRVTYVIDRNGVVVHKFNSMRDAERHVKEALAALEKKS